MRWVLKAMGLRQADNRVPATSQTVCGAVLHLFVAKDISLYPNMTSLKTPKAQFGDGSLLCDS